MVNERQAPRLSSPQKQQNFHGGHSGATHLLSSQGNPAVPRGASSLPKLNDLQNSLSDWTEHGPASHPEGKLDSAPKTTSHILQNTSSTLGHHLQPGAPSHEHLQLPLNDRTNTPEFGKTSPIRNLMQKDDRKAVENRVFMPPKSNKHRTEIQNRAAPPHLPTAGSSAPNSYANPRSATDGLSGASNSSAQSVSRPVFQRPSYLQNPQASHSADIVEIPRPVNFAPKSVQPAPMPMYSMKSSFEALDAFKPSSLTGPPFSKGSHPDDEDGAFDANRLLGDDRFSYDPSNYVDASKASEDLKNLLEGAFEEDEEDKPKRNLRRRKASKKDDRSAVDELAERASGLDIKADPDTSEPQKGEDDDDEEDDGTVDGLDVRLLPHQIDGLTWMMDKEVGEKKRNGVLPKGGILADDMGLGKTIQALALVLSNPRPSVDAPMKNPKRKIPKETTKGTLVVAPLALIKQWESEIKNKVSSDRKLKVLVHHGPSRTKRFEDLKKYDMVITTYQTLTSEHEATSPQGDGIKVGCFGVHWYRVILDEAHSIKNRNAKMTKAAYALMSVYRWCLTGTPMQNNLDELQSLIRFLQVRPYQDLSAWKDAIGNPMKNGRGGLAMKRLQLFLKAFMKRRTKDVLKKDGALTFGKGSHSNNAEEGAGFRIVGRKVETVVADFSELERHFYDRLATRTEKSLDVMMGADKKDYIGALVLLLRLRQSCNHPDLTKGKVAKDKDSVALAGSQSHKKDVSVVEDLDDVTKMFGDLSVETKKCDVCQVVIDSARASTGAIRCLECEEDLAAQQDLEREQKRLKKHQKSTKPSLGGKRRIHTNRVIESDAESEEEGEWIVSPSGRTTTAMGKAGGQADEDAEGGGEWLVSGDEAGRHEVDSQASDDSDDSLETGLPVASTKIRRLLQILKKESSEHKFIVFSEFTSMLDLITPHLRRVGHRPVRYDGSMRNDEREGSLHALRTNPNTRIMLCSLRCGSLGLNLTAASRVVILEPFWNPFVEEQAIDRVHRINQTQDVVVYKLTIAGSVEQRILALQDKKRELAKAAIEGGAADKNAGVSKLTMGDILKLFNRDAEHDPEHAKLGDGGLPKDLAVLRDTGREAARQVAIEANGAFARQDANHSGNRFGTAFGRR